MNYLNKVKMWDLIDSVNPEALSILLCSQSYCSDSDILFENMMSFFIEEELYEYAAVLRDEISFRNSVIIEKNND